MLHGWIFVGALWGFVDVAGGLVLRTSCGGGTFLMTGSLLTGLSYFFLAGSVGFSGRIRGVWLMLCIIVGMKVLSAPLMGVPVVHGAILNPVFAYGTQVGIFFALGLLMSGLSGRGPVAWAGIGAGCALAAAFVFPLVGHVTGMPACLHPGTSLPLSIVYSPLAAGVGAIAGPSGVAAGRAFAHATAGGDGCRIPFWVAADGAAVFMLAATLAVQVWVVP